MFVHIAGKRDSQEIYGTPLTHLRECRTSWADLHHDYMIGSISVMLYFMAALMEWLTGMHELGLCSRICDSCYHLRRRPHPQAMSPICACKQTDVCSLKARQGPCLFNVCQIFVARVICRAQLHQSHQWVTAACMSPHQRHV